MVRHLLVAGVVVGLLSCGEPTGGGPPVPASLSIITGNTQTDTIGAHLTTPLGVRVLTATGAGVPGITVQFAASGNGSVAPTQATTDATGLASATWTLRTLVGPDTVKATVAVLTGQQAVFTAVVNPGRLAHLTLTPDTVRFFKLQDTTKVLAAGTDRALNPVVLGALQWSTAVPGIASVTQAGVVQSVARGRTTASAQDPTTGVVDTTRVIVSQTPADIVVQPGADTLNWLTETLQLGATAHDSGGSTITGVPFTWQSLDNAVALVDTVGEVTAVTAGAARIQVAYLGLADTAAILVRQIPASVSIAVSDTLAAFTDTAAAAGLAQDSGGALISGTILNWSSSNSSIAEVVAPKVIVARANGSAIIQANLGALQDTEGVVVRQRAVDVQVQPPSATLAIGDSTQFHAIAYDRHGFAIDSSIVPLTGVWRPLNVNWASVSPSGFATARAAGVAGVVFKQDTTADTAAVTVTAPILGPVTSWEWKNPLPQGNTLQGVSGNADNNIYAVGTSGTIVHFDGGSWTPLPRIDVPVLADVWVSPTGQVFMAAGDFQAHGFVIHGNGPPWTVDTIPPYSLARAVWGVTDTSVFAINDAFRVLKYNGTAWSEIGNLAVNQVQDIEGVSSTLLYVSGAVPVASSQEGAILRYDGVSWTQVYQGFLSVTDLWVAPDSSVYAVGQGQNCTSSVLHSNGAAWDTVANFATSLYRIQGRTQSDIYAAGSCNGFDVKAHWNGAAWTTVQVPTLNNPAQLWVSPGGEWVAVGPAGAIETNTGAGWSTVTTGLRGFQYVLSESDMWLASAGEVYITGRDSRLFKWNASALSEVTTPISGVPSPVTGVDRPLNAIWGASPSDLYIGGGGACFTIPLNCDGMLAHFNGSTWNAVYTQGIIIDVIWGTAPDDIFALGAEAGMHFDGTSWTRTGQGVFDGDRIKAVWGYRSNDVWACGNQMKMYHYDGIGWSYWGPSPVACGSLFGFSATDIYMSGLGSGSNTIAHFNGTSWTAVYTGPVPAGAPYDATNVWGSGPSDVHVAFANEYLRFNGTSWQSQPLIPMGPVMIRGDSRGSIFGSGEVAGFILGHQ